MSALRLVIGELRIIQAPRIKREASMRWRELAYRPGDWRVKLMNSLQEETRRSGLVTPYTCYKSNHVLEFCEQYQLST